MDRKWMFANRLSIEYENGVNEFLQFAILNAKNFEKIPCPCKDCVNVIEKSANDVQDDLFVCGIDPSYTSWKFHGEEEQPSIFTEAASDGYTSDQLEEMVEAVAHDFHDQADALENVLRDAREPLYSSCTGFTKLSAILKLFNLKATHGWTDVSFTSLLKLLTEMLPDDNVLPNSTYKAKKLLCSIGMKYEKIHACPNDCVLYRKEFASLERCPNTACRASRFKRDRVPAKVVWYFPIIPRFKRLFGNAEEAKKLRWHAEERISDGKLRHPADSTQWVNIDHQFPAFGRDPRNLRLALSTDGMNPHSSQSSTYSIWPVLLVIYNLPPWLCMRRKYMMLSMLISGPRQPGNDIDVYLQPLVDDLQLLWGKGVEVYDAHAKETFSLQAMLFCTINDFPAYGNLAGFSVKGYFACPYCEDNTNSRWLKNSSKMVYLGTRRFLPINHRYRRLRKAFDGDVEEEAPPRPLTMQKLLTKKNVDSRSKKRGKGRPDMCEWKRKSILFSLVYWEHLYVRHSLDVMHIEKNLCDSLLGTLLNVPGKTKDNLKARLDMGVMNIRPELAPNKRGERTYLPPASYTLSRKEKDQFCDFFSKIKVPSGFSANVQSLVNLKEAKLQGMKSHDCHVVMQEFLPIAIRSILPKDVRNAITRLCFFFKKICSKVIDPSELDALQSDIVLTICQLEMYFPPSFFDIMVHLTLHLVREIRFCGPVYLRWMYPFERHMKVLKGYVKNRFRPEGCIVERYIVEEAAEFCAEYLSATEAIGLPKKLTEDVTEGRGTSGLRVKEISKDMWHQAHLYVLHNSNEVEPYVEEHMSYLRKQYPTRKTEKWIQDEHNRSFIQWLSDRILEKCTHSDQFVSPTLLRLSQGPLFDVASFSGFEINGYTFYTRSHDDKSANQNSGVTLVAESLHISSAKDRNPIYGKMAYYGVIQEIWELDYIEFKVPVFRCRWVDVANGVQIDELGFIRVDLCREGYKNDQFILASQAKQVFYVSDPLDSKWSIVLSTKERYTSEYTQVEDDLIRTSVIMPPLDTNVNENEIYMRGDHGEGIVIDNGKK